MNQLESKVNQLEIDLQNNLQYNRLNNIVISGIPKDIEHGDLKEVSLGIMNACLETEIEWRDMEACHRISKKSDDVVCRLVNREDVDEVLQNRKKLQAFNRESVHLPEGTEIFVNTHLTPYKSKLAYHCRELKRKGKLKKSTRKGIIKVLIDSDGDSPDWKVISHTNDLIEIYPELVL